MDLTKISKISNAKITLPLQKKYSLTQEYAKQLRAKHWKIFLPTEISSRNRQANSKYQRAREKEKLYFKTKHQLTFPKDINKNKESFSSKELGSLYDNGKKSLSPKKYNFTVEQVDLCNYNIKFARSNTPNQKNSQRDKTKSNEFKIKPETYSELKTTLCNPMPNRNIQQQCYCINPYQSAKPETLSVPCGNFSDSFLSRNSFYNIGFPHEAHPHNFTTYQRGGAFTNWSLQENADNYFNNRPAPHRFTWLNSYEDDWELNYYQHENERRHYQWVTAGRNYCFNAREHFHASNFSSSFDFAFCPWNVS